jgi:hypothetical protein
MLRGQPASDFDTSANLANRQQQQHPRNFSNGCGGSRVTAEMTGAQIAVMSAKKMELATTALDECVIAVTIMVANHAA